MNPNRQFSQALKNYKRPLSRTINAHIDRWIEHGEADRVWAKIALACPNLKAEEFIRQVINLRAAASGLAATKSVVERSRNHVLAYHRKRILDALKSPLPFYEIAAKLEVAADDAAFDLRHQTSVEKWVAILGLPDEALSRKNKNGSLEKRAFILALGDYVAQRCGRRMDAEVATLTDMAFSDADTTVDMVRTARRATTAKERKKRR